MNNTNAAQEEIKYSKLLSSLFCSVAIVALSILSLLNNLSVDIYSTYCLLKVVLPAAFCFWFIGFSIGKILDSFSKKIVEQKIVNEKEAYEIPSLFSGAPEAQVGIDDEFGIL